ncbi:MAG: 1-acyl-sn-glycerol-3-phosphate acyltransferase [Gemmatimonadota bacterium]|nr:1-acyl-sn-glycerol-3-phosphate acyltransferase [Gemmatimonadota bacterium]
MSHALAYVAGVLTAIGIVVVIAMLAARWWKRWTHRAALRVHKRFGARVDRFKFADRRGIVQALLDDPTIAAAVRTHAAENKVHEEAAWARVRVYLGEIVPQFSLIFYYQVGLAIAEPLLKLFFKVTVVDQREGALAALPKDSVVIYLMNHRSNADYVLAGYALAGQVAISYAVGEWARVFPLEYLFKSFGAYFVRRRFREPLYHTVLERYVQLITRNGVTQGIFPEGGLSRDGKFRPAKIGLLDYILGVARDPAVAERVYIVPVAINYDRVLEDRSLLRELNPDMGRRPPPLLAQLAIVLWNVIWNIGRIVTRSWKRHGDAVAVIGAPVPVAPWFAEVAARGTPLLDLPREERLAEVQKLADDAMRRIGEILPVPAVPLVCAAIQTLNADYLPRAQLLERVDQLRESLADDGRVMVAPDEPTDQMLDRALELLWIRRGVARSADGIVVLSSGRELVSYYANSIAHLLGEFETAVKARDVLPVYSVVDL